MRIETGWEWTDYPITRLEVWDNDKAFFYKPNPRVTKLLIMNYIACLNLLQTTDTPTRYIAKYISNVYMAVSDCELKTCIGMHKEKCIVYFPLLPSFGAVEKFITEESYNGIVEKVNILFKEIDNIMDTKTANVYDVQRRVYKRNHKSGMV